MVSCCVVVVLAVGIMYFLSPIPAPPPASSPANNPIPATSHTPVAPTSHTPARSEEDGHLAESAHGCLKIDRDVIDQSHLVALRYRSRKGKEGELRVSARIASQWTTLGKLFKMDTKLIANNHAGESDSTLHCCQDLLEKWIEEGGTESYPSNWHGLIKALKAIQLKQLAKDIEEALDCVLT